MRLTAFRFMAITFLALTLTSCASDKEKEGDKLPPDEAVEVLYNKAAALLDNNQYKSAAKAFAEVERQHPYSQWATRAHLMEAYSDYQNLDYDEAIVTLDQFIELHPGNGDISYAYYLRALSYYERIADVRRDQTYAHEALKGMQDIVSRYPDTTYAKDANLKIALINDHLAGSEMETGRWYLGQKLYVAALGRFRTVVEKYQTTSHVPEALERMVECYVATGIKDEAKSTTAVLGFNFPGSPWYADAYDLLVKNNLTPEPKEGWVDHVWHSVF